MMRGEYILLGLAFFVACGIGGLVSVALYTLMAEAIQLWKFLK